MSGLVLTLRAPPKQRVDLSALTPDRLQGVDAAAIAKLSLQCGNRPIAVGELFTIASGEPDDLRLVGDCGKFDRIGADMTRGAITVEGDAGAYLGHAMRGGRMHVRGNAGVGAAQEMRGGEIAIDGNAGDFLGGARPGEMKGMSGGLAIVRGNAGDRVGDRMRRGTIIVRGRCGAIAGTRMLGGTIWTDQGFGANPGLLMRRGTLIGPNVEKLLATFVDTGKHDFTILRVLSRYLAATLGPLAPRPISGPVRKYAGDLATIGKGELLIAG